MDVRIEYLCINNKEEWDDFCYRNNDAWFRHTTMFIDYIVDSRYDEKSINRSFLVYLNNELAAIAPLVIQVIWGEIDQFEFGMLDTDIPFPSIRNNLGKKNRKQILKEIFRETHRIAEEYNISLNRTFIDPLTFSRSQS